MGLSPHHKYMKYVFRKEEISESVWPEIFAEPINLNINLQIIVLGVIWMTLLVYLTCKNLVKISHKHI